MNTDSEGEEEPKTDRLLRRRDAMDTARQSHNQRQKGLTAVYLFPEASSPSANNLDCCRAEKANKAESLRLSRLCGLMMALSVSICVHLWLESGGH